MSKFVSESHRVAFDKMSDARSILFQELHYPACRTHELVEGVDRLGLAFEFVEHPLETVHLCPQCESFCLEVNLDGSYLCLSCDHQWS